jgi:hypothetical protein
VNDFQFEIFSRGVDRYSWRLVTRDDHRQVLARSLVDFPTPLLAHNGVLVMKHIAETADIITVDDGYGQAAGFTELDAFPLRVRNAITRRDAGATTANGPAAMTVTPAEAKPPTTETPAATAAATTETPTAKTETPTTEAAAAEADGEAEKAPPDKSGERPATTTKASRSTTRKAVAAPAAKAATRARRA